MVLCKEIGLILQNKTLHILLKKILSTDWSIHGNKSVAKYVITHTLVELRKKYSGSASHIQLGLRPCWIYGTASLDMGRRSAIYFCIPLVLA